MPIHSRKWNICGRRMIVLLLLCGLFLPIFQQTTAASISYEYQWIKDVAGLPTDGNWHDYFIAWEDLEDTSKVWFTDYNWYTTDGDNNIDVGGSSWMEYKAASTLPNGKAERFTSQESLGHMQIRYVGKDADNGNSPKYYIRVSKINGGYSYFTAFEPTNNEKEADAFTFEDHGDVFHIFVNKSGIDRYLTRDNEYLETTYSSSSGGGEKYRPMRVYRQSFFVQETEEEITEGEVTGKVTLYEYYWVNTADELVALSKDKQWQDVIFAWNDAYLYEGKVHSDPKALWYTKGIWSDNDSPNYKNDFDDGRFAYWSNEQLGGGYTSGEAESFVLPRKLNHFQVKFSGWDSGNEIKGAKDKNGREIDSPMFQIRFSVDSRRYIYLDKYEFSDNSGDAKSYTTQMFLEENKKNNADYYYGYVHVFQNLSWAEDEYFARNGNRLALQEHNNKDDWQYYFRIYACREVQYDAIVKSFTVGKGATYSIGKQLILKEGVTITVEDGGVLMVDQQLLNNGNILVKKGGTVIVNEGGNIMAYSENTQGKIKLDGGSLILMDNAKVICDEGDGVLQAINGASIVNRGALLVGKTLELRNNSYLKNEAAGILLVGGRVHRQRGSMDQLSASSVASCVSDSAFVVLCSAKSKLINYGIISIPRNAGVIWDSDNSSNILNQGQTLKR